MKGRSILPVVVSLALWSSCGLLEPGSDPTRLYVLATIEELEPARAPAPRLERALGIGPVSFPEYLHTELVSREGLTRVVPWQHERWAEPLEEALPRVLSSNLACLTGARPISYPWFETEAPEARLRIRFERFELEEHARAVLLATWSLEGESAGAVHEHRSHIVRALDDASGASAVVELSRALAELCLEIAAAWSAEVVGGNG